MTVHFQSAYLLNFKLGDLSSNSIILEKNNVIYSYSSVNIAPAHGTNRVNSSFKLIYYTRVAKPSLAKIN